MGDEVVDLEEKPEVASPQRGPSPLGPAGQHMAVDADLTAVGLVQPGQAGQQR